MTTPKTVSVRKIAGAYLLVEDEQSYLVISFEDGDDAAQAISEDSFKSWQEEGLVDKTPASEEENPEDDDNDPDDDMGGLGKHRGPSDD